MNILIVDTETSGLHSPPIDNMVEVGAIKWSVKHATILECWSALIDAPKPPHPVTGIPPAATREGYSLDDALDRLHVMAGGCTYLFAHNASFDRKFLGDYLSLPWACTMTDVVWPNASPSRKLEDIVKAHGVSIGVVHRALDDCLLIARALEKVAEAGQLGTAFARLPLLAAEVSDSPGGVAPAPAAASTSPKIWVRAMVSFASRQLAKDAGFSWKPEPKWWVKEIASEDAGSFPFACREIEEVI